MYEDAIIPDQQATDEQNDWVNNGNALLSADPTTQPIGTIVFPLPVLLSYLRDIQAKSISSSDMGIAINVATKPDGSNTMIIAPTTSANPDFEYSAVAPPINRGLAGLPPRIFEIDP